MNKLLIVLLAVCLVSVHSAVVKREAESDLSKALADAQKKLQEITETMKTELGKAFNPDEIKKNFGASVDEFNKLFTSASTAPKQ